MSTRVGLSGGSVVGALGDAWAHRCNVRLLLSTTPEQDTQHRLALLLKSNVANTAVATFQVIIILVINYFIILPYKSGNYTESNFLNDIVKHLYRTI